MKNIPLEISSAAMNTDAAMSSKSRLKTTPTKPLSKLYAGHRSSQSTICPVFHKQGVLAGHRLIPIFDFQAADPFEFAGVVCHQRAVVG